MGQDESSMVEASEPSVTLADRSLQAVADHIASGDVERIVVLTGAGISTAAGIPDFRSPKTGLYHNLARLQLPYAEAVFDISYFREKPEPFYVLAKELYPGRFRPTVSHAFIALLARRGLLLRLFTQNIDCLERAAGVPADIIVEAHGSFATQRCIECAEPFPDDAMRAHVLAGRVPRCEACPAAGLVKPDITFFGEPLPRAFAAEAPALVVADLVLVMGTSLSVYPFAQLPDMARPGVPRLLLNLERVGALGSRPDDVLELGACDEGVRRLADLLGWREELEDAWRQVVGEAEAERQARSRAAGEDEVEDEVGRLADEMEALLGLSELEVQEKPGSEPEEPHQQEDDEPEEPRQQEDGEPEPHQQESVDEPEKVHPKESVDEDEEKADKTKDQAPDKQTDTQPPETTVDT